MIVAIDGPAGSGKTTVAKILAEKLKISYLDTGATYRALTYSALIKKIDLTDSNSLKKLAEEFDLRLDKGKVYLGNQEITDEIRRPIIDKNISIVVSHRQVREVMVALQRKLGKQGDFVVEGRDITTVVFPESKHKFYLDADPKIRIQRRHRELSEKGLGIEFKEVEIDLEKRDFSDKNRKIGPLAISEDAICIDTSNLSIEQTADEILKHIPR